MNDKDDHRSPANLLNAVERQICRLYPGEGDADPVDTAEVLLCILLPQLRSALRDAGLILPACGPDSASWLINEARATEAEAKDARETALYRWWDAADVLLYAGIADHIGNRTKDHAKGSSWMDFAVRSAVERHPRRSLALAAEEVAIKAEHPIFNKQHNDTPEALRRQVEYLIAHDRLDLLAPAVSRG